MLQQEAVNMQFLLFYCLGSLSGIVFGYTVNNRPIIGVLAQETKSHKYGDSYLSATYVHYLESAGARVVPIFINQPQSYYEKIFRSINGVLFPGGGAGIEPSVVGYARSGQFFYNLAIQAYDKKDYFPIWGTCQGLQLLTFLTVGKNLLQHTDTDNMSLPLEFTKDFRNSRLFKNVPQEVFKILQSENVTQNEHVYSILMSVFKSNRKLNSFYKSLSTNRGRRGVTFLSTMEGVKYPFYGVQWHPEKNIFNWNPHYVTNHSADAVKISQYFADFFVNEARKSNHRFDSAKLEAASVIQNYQPVYLADGSFSDLYYFNSTQMKW